MCLCICVVPIFSYFHEILRGHYAIIYTHSRTFYFLQSVKTDVMAQLHMVVKFQNKYESFIHEIFRA
jgi:hypothetical protein